MRDKLIQYIDLLFAGTPASQEVADLKEELTRNTLDRFDDLVQQGKSEEAAYNLAVAGIGDINELLQQMKPAEQPHTPPHTPPYTPPAEPKKERVFPAIGRGLVTITWVLAVLLYLEVSFSTSAWHITWLIFPIAGAADQLIHACFDLSRRVAQFVVSLVLLVILSLLLVGLLLSNGTAQFGFNNDYLFKDSEYNVGSATIGQPVNEVDITWINGSVTVEHHNGSTVELRESGDLKAAEQLRWRLQNGRLTVYPRKSFWFFGFFNIGNLPEKHLTLRLPAGSIPDDMEINAVSASIDITGLQAGNIKIEQVSGNTTLRQVTGDELELDGVSGRLDCTDCSFTALNSTTVSGNLQYTGSLSAAEIDAVSGDTRIESTQMLQDLECDSVSGDFRITMPDGSGFTAEMDSVSGDLRSDFPLTAEGDAQAYGTGSAEYNFDTVSGDVYLTQK